MSELAHCRRHSSYMNLPAVVAQLAARPLPVSAYSVQGKLGPDWRFPGWHQTAFSRLSGGPRQSFPDNHLLERLPLWVLDLVDFEYLFGLGLELDCSLKRWLSR